MTVSYVVIVFSLSKLIQHIGFRVWYADVGIPPNSSHANASSSKAGPELAELALHKGATQKAQHLELISYPEQALWLPMTRSFPSLPYSLLLSFTSPRMPFVCLSFPAQKPLDTDWSSFLRSS